MIIPMINNDDVAFIQIFIFERRDYLTSDNNVN